MSAAADLIASIIDNAMTTASTKQTQADSYSKDAIMYAMGGGSANPPGFSFHPNIEEPNVFIPSTALGVNTGLYNSTYDQIYTMLTDAFTGFFGTYFPLSSGADIAAAEAWMTKALTVGGTGLPAYIEAQIWERDRSRLIADGARAEDEVINTWAGRRYPLPPGAATYQVLQVRRDVLDKSAQASRDVAIKQAELEIENIKFSIEHVLQFRIGAIQAAAEYMKALALAPELASKMALAAIDAQAKLISAASEYYRARIAVETLKFEVAKTGPSFLMDAQRINVPAWVQTAGNVAQAATAAAAAAGNMGAAALNSLHSQANLSDITNN
jgi:hypothetical protein